MDARMRKIAGSNRLVMILCVYSTPPSARPGHEGGIPVARNQRHSASVQEAFSKLRRLHYVISGEPSSPSRAKLTAYSCQDRIFESRHDVSKRFEKFYTTIASLEFSSRKALDIVELSR